MSGKATERADCEEDSYLPMWPRGQRTRPPCAVERDALSITLQLQQYFIKKAVRTQFEDSWK